MALDLDFNKLIIKPITDVFTSSLSALWDSITGSFNWMSTQLSSGLLSVTNTVISGLSSMGSQLNSGLLSVTNSVTNTLSSVISNFVSWISGAFTTATETWIAFQQSKYDSLCNFIGPPLNILKSSLSYMGAQLHASIVSSGAETNQAIQNLWAGMSQWSHDVQMEFGKIGDWFGDLGESIKEGLGNAANLWWEYQENKTDWLWSGFKKVNELLWKGLQELGQWIWDEVVQPQIIKPTGLWKGILDFFQTIAQTIFTAIENVVLGETEITPGKAPEMGMRAFGATLGLGMTSHLFTKVIELLHPLKNMGMSQISGFLADLGQFHRVGDATIGNMIKVTLGKPNQYYYQDKYRPYIPDDSMLQTLAYKEDIPMEKFYESMGYLGYSEYWTKAIETTMYREPRYFELIFMVEDNFTSPAWLENKIRRSGYCEADVPNVIVGLTKRTMKSDRNNYIKAAINMYKEGYMDESEFNIVIDRLDLDVGSGAFIEFDKSAGKFVSFELEREHKYLIKEAANMESRTRIMNEYKYSYQEQYQKGLMNENDLRLALSTLGLTLARIESIVNLEQARKEPDLREKALEESELEFKNIQYKLTSKYIILFKENLISAAQLYIDLITIGLSELMARVTVELEYTKKYKEELPEGIIQIG